MKYYLYFIIVAIFCCGIAIADTNSSVDDESGLSKLQRSRIRRQREMEEIAQKYPYEPVKPNLSVLLTKNDTPELDGIEKSIIKKIMQLADNVTDATLDELGNDRLKIQEAYTENFSTQYQGYCYLDEFDGHEAEITNLFCKDWVRNANISFFDGSSISLRFIEHKSLYAYNELDVDGNGYYVMFNSDGSLHIFSYMLNGKPSEKTKLWMTIKSKRYFFDESKFTKDAASSLYPAVFLNASNLGSLYINSTLMEDAGNNISIKIRDAIITPKQYRLLKEAGLKGRELSSARAKLEYSNVLKKYESLLLANVSKNSVNNINELANAVRDTEGNVFDKDDKVESLLEIWFKDKDLGEKLAAACLKESKNKADWRKTIAVINKIQSKSEQLDFWNTLSISPKNLQNEKQNISLNKDKLNKRKNFIKQLKDKKEIYNDSDYSYYLKRKIKNLKFRDDIIYLPKNDIEHETKRQ